MESTGLEFYTVTELIAELMRRRTFLGVVVHSEEELKNGDWGEERTFKVHYNSNLDVLEAGRLLDAIAERIALHNDLDAA
jgi:hypothetical protein